MTLMKPGKASYSSLYLWSRYQGLVSGRLQGHGGKVSECWTAVMLLQRSSEAPAPSLVLSLFILKIPFGVKYILVHFICMSCLFHKLWGPKGGVTSSYLGSFPDPWRHAFKLSRWSNWNSWLLGQWVLYKLTFFFKVIQAHIRKFRTIKYYKEMKKKSFLNHPIQVLFCLYRV